MTEMAFVTPAPYCHLEIIMYSGREILDLLVLPLVI